MSTTIKLLIADDHPSMCEGMQLFFERQKGIKLIGIARNGKEAITLAQKLKPDIILMDVVMKVLDGKGATRQIKSKNPDAKIIGVSAYREKEKIIEMLLAGACGYVSKDETFQEFVRAINIVQSGKYYFSPDILDIMIRNSLLGYLKQEILVQPVLTKREYEVLKSIVEGYSTKEIADSLNRSTETIASHRKRIMAKLGVKSKSELIRLVKERGISNSSF